MRIAVISDIHGNWTALEAVIADLRAMAPDVVLHGGDLADSGSSPVEVFDRVRELGWRGVLGNTDEMLVRPEALEEFAGQSKAPAALWERVREIAAATRAVLGEERLEWMRGLPLAVALPGFALVHAQPGDCWRAPAADAPDAELERIVRIAGSAGGGVWAHASAVDSEADGESTATGEHGECWDAVRWRSACGLFTAG